MQNNIIAFKSVKKISEKTRFILFKYKEFKIMLPDLNDNDIIDLIELYWKEKNNISS